MSHRAKHLRRNWIPDRMVNIIRGRGPVSTARTTGSAQRRKHEKRMLPVVAFLKGVR